LAEIGVLNSRLAAIESSLLYNESLCKRQEHQIGKLKE